MTIDVSEVRKLEADLKQAATKVLPEVRNVVQKGALNIKQDWQKTWSGHAHAPALPAAVSYDTTMGAGGISAEIGPDKGKTQGPLGNIYEFGTPKNSPIPAGGPALAREEPKYQKALADCLADLLEG